MIVILSLAILALAAYLVYLSHELKEINRQLDYIYDNDTNAELTHVSKNKILVNYVFKANRIIRKVKEEERQRIQQERELYQTLTSLSHDLRTPLTTAYGYTQLLKEENPENPLIPKVSASLKETTEYLDSIVDYTSISEKQSDLSFETLNLSEFVGKHVLQYYDIIQAKGIDLELDIDKDIKLISDRLLLQRIVTNLVGNLIKYGASESKIALKKTDETVNLIFENNTKDEMQTKENMTQRFVTHDKSRTNKSIGLGLNIIEKCCDILDATMTIETEDQTFKIIVAFNKGITQ